MSVISFMSANYVAQQAGYHVTRGWSQGDQATNAYFQPLASFAERFERLLLDVRALGFQALDLWTAHLHYAWATPEHLAIAQDLLQRYDLAVMSYAGWFGSTPQEIEAACRVAATVGAPILGGRLDLGYWSEAVSLLREHGVRLAIENHPEKTPEEMLAQIGHSGDGLVGTTVDTGWYATQGYDAAEAIRHLGHHVFHVHLKDVLTPGAHDTCRFGDGIVPLPDCIRVLQEIGYRGAYSVEHEPYLFDPTDDIRASLTLLRGWLQQAEV